MGRPCLPTKCQSAPYARAETLTFQHEEKKRNRIVTRPAQNSSSLWVLEELENLACGTFLFWAHASC